MKRISVLEPGGMNPPGNYYATKEPLRAFKHMESKVKNEKCDYCKKNKKKKLKKTILKVLVFVLFLSGCLYQVIKYFGIYFQFPVTLDIQFKFASTTVPPSITLCTSNGILRSSFCSKFPEKCAKPNNLTEFCEQHVEYCEYVGNYSSLNDLKLPITDVKGNNQSYYAQLGATTAQFIPVCTYLTATLFSYCKPSYVLPNNKISATMGLCYVLNSRQTLSSWNEPLVNIKMAPLPSFGILVDFMPHEKVDPNEDTHGQMLVASPYDITDPALYGQDIEPGNVYMITANPVEKFLLPPPYTTNCRDYVSEWKKKNYTGPLGLDSCVIQCSLKHQLKAGNCSLAGLWYPHNHSFCENEIADYVTAKVVTVDCYKECRRPCYSLDFEVEVKVRSINDYAVNQLKQSLSAFFNKNLTKDQIRKRYAQVAIYFRKPEIYSYTYYAKYEAIEIFSYLGGYLGMWLGLSLLSMYESMTWIITHFKFCQKK